MQIIDVSLTLSNDIPVWEGDPKVVLEKIQKIEDGAEANVSKLSMCVHTGTHIDAPVHFVHGGKSVDSIHLQELIGPCFVLELPQDVDLITREVVDHHFIPPGVSRLLFKTQNSQRWALGPQVFEKDFVALSSDAAMLLVEKGIKVVGIDYLSIAPFDKSKPTHEILLKNGIIVIEGMDLRQVTTGYYTLICLPLKLLGADGAPCRVALIDEV